MPPGVCCSLHARAAGGIRDDNSRVVVLLFPADGLVLWLVYSLQSRCATAAVASQFCVSSGAVLRLQQWHSR